MRAFLLVLILFFFSFSLVEAHRSGCHRWHSCPSDSGSYTCGDTGHCSGCPDNQYCEDRKVRTLRLPDPSSHIESTSVPIKSCEGGHWISDNHGGKMIVLENGSKWMVDDIDTIDTFKRMSCQTLPLRVALIVLPGLIFIFTEQIS